MNTEIKLTRPKKLTNGKNYLVHREHAGWKILRYENKRWYELHQTYYGTASTTESFERRSNDKFYKLPE